MKPKTHIRIICLKNNSRQIHHQSGLIAAGTERQQREKEPLVTPSLAYLSARLQFGKDYNRENMNKHRSLIGSGVQSFKTLEMTQTQSLNVQQQMVFPTIQKYVEGQKTIHDTKKVTIRNMMGSIDFSPNKRKENKIARTIRHTIDKLAGTQRVLKKNRKYQKEGIRNCSPQNRTFLAQDFQRFLCNKKQEFIRAKQPRMEDQESHKIKRLAVVNPQKEIDKTHEQGQQLNLFSFQERGSKRENNFETLPSFMRSSPQNIARSRLQKKIFKMGLNPKTQQDQFSWIKLPSRMGFQLGLPQC